jgi:hypothetical protein
MIHFRVLNCLLKLFLSVSYLCVVSGNEVVENGKDLFKIEGKVIAPDHWPKANGDWRLQTDVLIDGGAYRAYLKYVYI